MVETIQAESHLIVNLVRKRSSMNSSASSSKIQAKTPLSDTKGEFPSPPKRVQRTTDLKERKKRSGAPFIQLKRQLFTLLVFFFSSFLES